MSGARAVADQLRRAFDELARDPRLVVKERTMGPAAPADEIAARRGQLPDELLDFLAEMNGVSFAWEYAGAPPADDWSGFGGGLHLPPLGAAAWVADQDGGPCQYLLVDDVRPGFGSYYEAALGQPAAAERIVFSETDALRRGALPVCASLFEYLGLAAQHRFGRDWADEYSAARHRRR